MIQFFPFSVNRKATGDLVIPGLAARLCCFPKLSKNVVMMMMMVMMMCGDDDDDDDDDENENDNGDDDNDDDGDDGWR